jgi:hypothetical protein
MPGSKLFRLTFIFARRKADMPDEPFFTVFEPLPLDLVIYRRQEKDQNR